MTTLPSKDLLSEVLKTPITKVQKADTTLLAYWDIYSSQHSLINIYELAHKCKELAWNKGYELVEEINRVTIKDKNGNFLNAIHSPLDKLYSIERCFKACEWIMEKTK